MSEKLLFYGIGQAFITDYKKPQDVIALVDGQEFSMESTSSPDPVTGGNKLTAIAEFDKDKEIKFSFTNATYESNLMRYTEGSEPVKGTAPLPSVLEVVIPSSGEITLTETPIENSVVVNGFTLATGSTAEAGKFKVATAEKKITFAVADAGKLVSIYYESNSAPETIRYSQKQTTLKKPFKFAYKQPIYDEDSQLAGYVTIVVYKARCTTGFSIDPKHLTAMAQKFEAKALDPRRADGIVWDYFYAPLVEGE